MNRVTDTPTAEEPRPDEVLVYRERHVAAWPWHLVGISLTVLATTPAWAGIYWVMPFPLFAALILWVASSSVRIAVSHRDIDVQHGLFGVRIPLSSIQAVNASTHDWGRHGFGVSRAADGTRRYHLARDAEKAVRVQWRDEGGRLAAVSFSTDEADQVVLAIEKVRSKLKPLNLS